MKSFIFVVSIMIAAVSSTTAFGGDLIVTGKTLVKECAQNVKIARQNLVAASDMFKQDQKEKRDAMVLENDEMQLQIAGNRLREAEQGLEEAKAALANDQATNEQDKNSQSQGS